jgi:hypothetical protein
VVLFTSSAIHVNSPIRWYSESTSPNNWTIVKVVEAGRKFSKLVGHDWESYVAKFGESDRCQLGRRKSMSACCLWFSFSFSSAHPRSERLVCWPRSWRNFRRRQLPCTHWNCSIALWRSYCLQECMCWLNLTCSGLLCVAFHSFLVREFAALNLLDIFRRYFHDYWFT